MATRPPPYQIMPVSGQVRVATELDPALQAEALSYGTLAKRLGAFKDIAFKERAEQAQATGKLYGIQNAPTIQDVEKAQKLGEPVEVVGDSTSVQVWKKAAYKGSLAVLEANYSTVARKALTEAVVKAEGNPTTTPETLQTNLQSVVDSYTKELAKIDPSSGAKLNSSLGIYANTRYVEFSRTYAKRILKAKKEETEVTLGEMTGTSLTKSIKNYYPQKNSASLRSVIALQQSNLEAYFLTHNVSKKDQIKYLEAFKKTMTETLINVVVEGPIFFDDDNPRGEASRFVEGIRKDDDSINQNIREAFAELDNKNKRKALKALMDRGKAREAELKLNEEAEKEEQKRLNEQHTREYLVEINTVDNDIEKLKKLRTRLNRELDEKKVSVGVWKDIDQRIENEIKEISKPNENGPTLAQKTLYGKLLNRIYLLPGEEKNLRADDVLKQKDLPIGANKGINLNSLYKIAQRLEKGEATEIKETRNNVLRSLKAQLGIEEGILGLGKSSPLNNRRKVIYARAEQWLDGRIQNVLKHGGSITEYIKGDSYFYKGFIQSYLMLAGTDKMGDVGKKGKAAYLRPTPLDYGKVLEKINPWFNRDGDLDTNSVQSNLEYIKKFVKKTFPDVKPDEFEGDNELDRYKLILKTLKGRGQ